MTGQLLAQVQRLVERSDGLGELTEEQRVVSANLEVLCHGLDLQPAPVQRFLAWAPRVEQVLFGRWEAGEDEGALHLLWHRPTSPARAAIRAGSDTSTTRARDRSREHLVNAVESPIVSTMNNAAEEVIRAFTQHYKTFCRFEGIETARVYLAMFEKTCRFTPFSSDAQARIRRKCPLELAGYEVQKLAMAQLFHGLALPRPTSAFRALSPVCDGRKDSCTINQGCGIIGSSIGCSTWLGVYRGTPKGANDAQADPSQKDLPDHRDRRADCERMPCPRGSCRHGHTSYRHTGAGHRDTPTHCDVDIHPAHGHATETHRHTIAGHCNAHSRSADGHPSAPNAHSRRGHPDVHTPSRASHGDRDTRGGRDPHV